MKKRSSKREELQDKDETTVLFLRIRSIK